MIGRAIVQYLRSQGFRVLCVVIGKVHGHAVVELPKDLPWVKRIIGETKRYSSCAVTFSLPGTVWSANGQFVPVETAGHLKASYEYDLYKPGPEAWSWS